MIVKDKIDVEKLFEKLDMSKDHAIDIKELEAFLLEIDKTINHEEVEYVFNKLDTDKSNTIEFDEFKKWLEENEVRMS